MTVWGACVVLLALGILAPAAAVPLTFSAQDGRHPFFFWAGDAARLTPPSGETIYDGGGPPFNSIAFLFFVTPFPQPTSSVPLHAQATLNGEVVATLDVLLPEPWAEHLTLFHTLGLGIGFRVPEGVYTPQAIVLDLVLPGDARQFTFTYTEPTPEPATLLLLSTALAGVGWVARKRRGR